MRARNATFVVTTLVAGWITLAPAQQTSPPATAPAPGAPAAAAGSRTIDCPVSASATTPSPTQVGTPQGAGQGSGLAGMPSTGPGKRIDGEIKVIGSTRTNRVIELGDVKLEVEPSTVVLLDCQPATVADLKEGAKIKATYEVKDNRNVATVIEAAR